MGIFPLQVLRPHAAASPTGCLSVVVLLSGGLLDGDAASIEIVVEPGARLAVRTQAATQVHAGRSRQTLRASVGEQAWLSYLPHALVPHADADYHAQTAIEMRSSSRVLLTETLAPGRLNCGERFAFRQVRLEFDVVCEGELIARERGLVRPDPAVQAAQFGAATHTASVYLLGPGEQAIEDACGETMIDRTPLARGGWYARAVSNHAAALDDVLRRLHESWAAWTSVRSVGVGPLGP
jgi:urease accessory protein UreH